MFIILGSQNHDLLDKGIIHISELILIPERKDTHLCEKYYKILFDGFKLANENNLKKITFDPMWYEYSAKI